MKLPLTPLLAALGLTVCEMQMPNSGIASANPDMPRHTYALDVFRDGRAGLPQQSATGGFDETFSAQGISFRVSSVNSGSRNLVRIEPHGLQVDNTVIEKDVEGRVTEAEVADLNGDGFPEIYVYANSTGSGSKGSLIAYTANKQKSLSEIYLPSLLDDPRTSTGYMGHDQFRVAGNSLVRRFPVYLGHDTNARPTGVIRQVQYYLVAGEAGWLLRPIKVINFG
jgi:hypothetical protein